MIKKPILSARQTVLCLSLALFFAACGKNAVGPAPAVPTPITPTPTPSKKWIVSTVAGSTTAGFNDGDTTQAQFSNAQGIVADNQGNLYVGDQGNASIRQVTYAGHVTTYAGKNISNPIPNFGNIYSLARDRKGDFFQ